MTCTPVLNKRAHENLANVVFPDKPLLAQLSGTKEGGLAILPITSLNVVYVGQAWGEAELHVRDQ